MDLKKTIRSIPDYPKKDILFRDITTLIKNEKAFAEAIDQLVDRSKKYEFDKIAAIESRGFVFASAMSYILKKPFIMLRKKNKLPADVHSVDFELEYGTATIEVHKDSFNENEKILIIDDLIVSIPPPTFSTTRSRRVSIMYTSFPLLPIITSAPPLPSK